MAPDTTAAAIAALLKDLNQRGLLDTTLVVWGSEFGRTALGDNRPGLKKVTGRDHHPYAFSLWMAGGGIKGGQVHGETDDFAWHVTKDPVSIHDFHATTLHLFGLEHKKLTYRFQGREFRLTDVEGEVVKELLGVSLSSITGAFVCPAQRQSSGHGDLPFPSLLCSPVLLLLSPMIPFVDNVLVNSNVKCRSIIALRS